jgi:mannosylglycerate hydrolase
LPTIYAYPHTHWDREWYQPFESFRFQLVAVVRRILDELESDNLSRFYLDGQSIVFDDVLEIEPELRGRLEANLRNGKLTAGPWYVLADQMLVSGESLIRNLFYGLATTRKLGPAAMIGYCPDTFGHTADLPRILSGFGIQTAVVWRGAPALEMGPLFWWSSPDGSRVLAYHLTRGYHQPLFHEAEGTANGAMDKLAGDITSWMGSRENGARSPVYARMDAALLPVGGDHMAPPAKFAQVVKQLNKRFQQNGQEIKIAATNLIDFINTVLQGINEKRPDEMQHVSGELRFNRTAPMYERSYLLYGVLSTRLYLKRANRLAEHQLTSSVEPLFALLHALKLATFPQTELDHAWKLLLKNQPHDSICGCSVDEVHDEMLTRYQQLDKGLQTLLINGKRAIAGEEDNAAIAYDDPEFAANQVAIFNTGSSTVAAPVRVNFNLPAGAKPVASAGLQIESVKSCDQLFSGWGRVPYYKQVESVDAWIWPGAVPGFGSKTLSWPVAESDGAEVCAPVKVRSHKLSNGLLEVSVAGNGRLVVSHVVPGGTKPKVYDLGHTLRDIGDGGDTYNYDPLPGDKPITARFMDSQVNLNGPLVGSLVLNYEIELPESAVRDQGFLNRFGDLGKIEVMKRSAKRVKHKITTEVSLRRGVPILFFTTTFDNAAKDHRMEVTFDTGSAVKASFSENHFSVIRREHAERAPAAKLPVELGHEAPPDRYPCQRFVCANGQLFLNEGLPEYGAQGDEISLTLLRAVSWLSRPRLWTRGGGAGPNVMVPGANCLGANKVSYGWAPLPVKGVGDKMLTEDQVAAAYELSELYEGRLWASFAKSKGGADGSLITLDNEAVRISASFVRDGALFLRLLNCSPMPQKLKLQVLPKSFKSAGQVNLNLEPISDLTLKKGALAVSLGANELITLKFGF